MPDHVNPYIAGAPVIEKKMFFGREGVFNWISNSLSGKYVDHILVIHGQRRVGKTSVLKHLPNRLPDDYIVIFIDLQGRVSTTLGRFLGWLAREIAKALKEEGINLPRPDREKFQEDPEYFETVFLPQLEEHLGEKRLLLTFDEFDTLESTNAQEGLALPFMAILKRLMEHRNLNFVFSIGSSGRKLENMQAAYTGFFKQALYRKISFLEPEDARDLITKPVLDVVSYTEAAVERILSVTNRHPYFIQLMCHELFSECQKSDKWQVDLPQVDGVLGAVIERGTVNLKFVWDEANDLEKWVLAILAGAEQGMPLQQLESSLKQERVRFTRQDLERSLVRLKDKDVLRDDNTFVIHLLRLWLQQNRSIEQVREELEEVNPIVSRLLEIGQEYHSKGEYDRAIQAFEEALQEAPENLEVHLWMGNSQISRGDYGRAVAEFEQVLEAAADDVVAQKGYCDAYLAMGDDRLTEDQLEQAEFAYQQVLTVNPNHEEALKRMAQLYHKRAVSAVLGGEEVALEEISKALEYNRQEGFEKIAADLKALIAGQQSLSEVLLSWGQRAKELELWEEARELLEAYRRESGDQETITRPLKEIEDHIRSRRQAYFKAQAQRLKNLERYPEAIECLDRYLEFAPEDNQAVQLEIEQLKKKVQDVRKLQRSQLSPMVRNLIIGFSVIVIGALTLWLTQPGSPLMAAQSQQATATATLEPTAAQIPAAIPTATLGPTPTAIPLSWTRLNSGLFLPKDSVTSFVFDPSDPEVMYLGTQNSGIYKTINGGITWQPAQNGMGGGHIGNLVINPQNPEILYAGVIDDGVYKTTDGGQNWIELSGGLPEETWQFTSHLAMDPNDPDHLYYTGGFSIYESTSAGTSWSQFNRREGSPFSNLTVGPDGALYVHCPWCDERISRVTLPTTGGSYMQLDPVYATADQGTNYQDFLSVDTAGSIFLSGIEDQLYRSTDGGATWQNTGLNCIGAVLDGKGNALCIDRLPYLSQDSGITWRRITAPADAEFLTGGISPLDPDTLILAGEGIFKSVDGGRTWTDIGNGLGNSPTQLILNPATNTLYLEDYRNNNGTNLYAASLGSRDFELVNANGEYTTHYTYVSPVSQEVYRFKPMDDRVFMSTNAGRTYRDLGVSGFDLTQASIVEFNQQETIFLDGSDSSSSDGSEEILLFSTDNGSTWTEIPFRILGGGGHALGRIVPAPVQENSLYAVSANLYFSGDGGSTWLDCYEESGTVSLGAWISEGYNEFAPHPTNPGEFFLGTKSAGLYFNDSESCSGMHRVPVSSGLDNDFIKSVVRNPENPDILYVGTNGGIYISYNNGQTWGKVNDGLLGALTIYSLVVDPDNPGDVYASTPYGIFKLEDR